MNRLKNWIVKKYLPSYARVSLCAELSKLQNDVSVLKQQIAEQQVMISTFKFALKCRSLTEIRFIGVDKYEQFVRGPEDEQSNN